MSRIRFIIYFTLIIVVATEVKRYVHLTWFDPELVITLIGGVWLGRQEQV